MMREVEDEGSDEAEENSDSDAEESDGSEVSEGGTLHAGMKFDDATKGKSKVVKTEHGIMGLKFMERAQQKEKEALKNQVNLAVKEMNNEDDYSGSEDDGDSEGENKPTENKKFVDSSNKFGVKSLKPKSKMMSAPALVGKEMDAEKVLKAARRVTSGTGKDSSDESEESEEPIFAQPAKAEKKSKAAAKTVSFGDDDLDNFNAEKNKLIKDKVINGTETADKAKDEESALLKSLFVTQEDDAMEEFE